MLRGKDFSFKRQGNFNQVEFVVGVDSLFLRLRHKRRKTHQRVRPSRLIHLEGNSTQPLAFFGHASPGLIDTQLWSMAPKGLRNRKSQAGLGRNKAGKQESMKGGIISDRTGRDAIRIGEDWMRALEGRLPGRFSDRINSSKVFERVEFANAVNWRSRQV